MTSSIILSGNALHAPGTATMSQKIKVWACLTGVTPARYRMRAPVTMSRKRPGGQCCRQTRE